MNSLHERSENYSKGLFGSSWSKTNKNLWRNSQGTFKFDWRNSRHFVYQIDALTKFVWRMDEFLAGNFQVEWLDFNGGSFRSMALLLSAFPSKFISSWLTAYSCRYPHKSRSIELRMMKFAWKIASRLCGATSRRAPERLDTEFYPTFYSVANTLSSREFQCQNMLRKQMLCKEREAESETFAAQ